MLFEIFLGVALMAVNAQSQGDQEGRIFIISTGHDYGAQVYINAEGYIKGFARDIIDAVCSAAGIDSRIVWNSKTGNCWNSGAGMHPSGGRAIMDRWFDGCSMLDATIERIHIFKFSAPYTKRPRTFFYYKKGGSFDERNLARKTIGIVKGWASSDKCIARQAAISNNILDENHTKAYIDPPTLLQALMDGQVDAAFADEFTFAKDDIDSSLSYQSSRPYLCILAGNSIMMRKDNDLTQYWNLGFQKLINTQAYHKLCEIGAVTHGHRGPIICDI